MLRPDNGRAFVPRGNQRLALVLVVLFGIGQFLNLFFQQAGIGSFGTNDLVDAWTLLVCIYAASVARCCVPSDWTKKMVAQSRLWSSLNLLSVSSVATIALAVLVGATFTSGDLDCTIVIGCACQVIAFIALFTIGFGDGVILANKVTSFAIALGLSFIGSGVLVVHQSTANLGVVLPTLFLLGWAARDIEFASLR
jgi:hypothetical protein